MVNVILPLFLFFFQILLLFFISRAALNQLFHFLRGFIEDEKIIFTLISVIFLPGTAVHELAHFFAATGLFLKVRDVNIFPRFEGNEIKLGHVLYEKKDFLRSILVGIAPIAAGLFFFFLLSFFKLFPNNNLPLNLLFAYLIFSVSSTMFSSKKDLVDIIYIIPTVLVLLGVIYVFNLRVDVVFKNRHWLTTLSFFLDKINFYLFLSLAINFIITIILVLLKNWFKK